MLARMNTQTRTRNAHTQMSVLQKQNEAQAEQLKQYHETHLHARQEWSLVQQMNVAKTEEIQRFETQVLPSTAANLYQYLAHHVQEHK